MSNAASVFARWRVRLGYILAVFVLWFARPTPECVAIGAAIEAVLNTTTVNNPGHLS